jgi:hypothetical protein
MGGGGVGGAAKCGLGQQASGIESRQGRVRVVHQQGDLGAAEHDGVAARLFHTRDDALMVSDRFGFEDAVNQFVQDDAIDFFALVGVRAHEFQTARGEFFGTSLSTSQRVPVKPRQRKPRSTA